MSITRITPIVGSLYALMRNRLGINVATPLESQELSCTIAPDRRLVVLGHTPISGFARDHGTVADEAAMLALHTLDITTLVAEPTFVAPGDSCLRADDPGWRWHCISGHGQALSDWERRPLAGALSGLAVSGHNHAMSDIAGLQSALDGKQAAAAVLSDLSDIDGALAYRGGIIGGSSGGFELDSDELIASLSPLAWWRADAGVEEADGDSAEDGDGVSRWLDQSGHGYHLTQASAGYRPTFEAGEIAGLPIIRFASHHLTNLTLPLDLKNHTMIVVARSTATSGQTYGRLACVGLPVTGDDYTVATAQVWSFDNIGTPEMRVNSGNTNYAVSLSSSQVGRPAALHVYGYRIAAGSAVLNASDLISVSATNGYSTDSVGLNIGCHWKDGAPQATTDNLHGDICEIVVFDRALGATLFGLVLSALAQKWGV